MERCGNASLTAKYFASTPISFARSISTFPAATVLKAVPTVQAAPAALGTPGQKATVPMLAAAVATEVDLAGCKLTGFLRAAAGTRLNDEEAAADG